MHSLHPACDHYRSSDRDLILPRGHQAEFRGFTIQAPPKEALSDPLTNKDATNNGQQENQTTTARPVLPPSTPPDILPNRYGTPSVVVYGKDTNVATPAIVASGGGAPRTRLASRESGESRSKIRGGFVGDSKCKSRIVISQPNSHSPAWISSHPWAISIYLFIRCKPDLPNPLGP